MPPALSPSSSLYLRSVLLSEFGIMPSSDCQRSPSAFSLLAARFGVSLSAIIDLQLTRSQTPYPSSPRLKWGVEVQSSREHRRSSQRDRVSRRPPRAWHSA